MNRREFLHGAGLLAAASSLPPIADGLAQAGANPDYSIHIAPTHLEIAPRRFVKTTAFNGQVPGALIRLPEGKTVTVDVINDTDQPDIVHWHGLHIPSREDGASEEGSPVSAPHGGVQRYVFPATPGGFRWYHSHSYAGHNLNRSMYTGEFGFLMIDRAHNPARYDQEIFLALHEWNGFASGGADGYEEVIYSHGTINGRMLGFGDPIRVREGERVLLHILNASATLQHTISLPGHKFLVTELDGNPAAASALVETIRLGPAERVDAIVSMTNPGVWVLGEVDDELRKSGTGIVVEYANRKGEPQWSAPEQIDFRYELFSAEPANAGHATEISVPLKFESKFEGYGDFDHWTINGLSWPNTKQIQLREGSRYRLLLENQSDDIHPIHLHRHTFEVRSINGKDTSGIFKDVLLLPTRATTEVVFTADNPGKTLFHCHQQDHMDSGFMMLFDYL